MQQQTMFPALVLIAMAFLILAPANLVGQDSKQEKNNWVLSKQKKIEWVRKELKDEYPLEYQISEYIEDLGADAVSILPELIDRIKIERGKVTDSECDAYIEILGKIGPPAKAAKPVLLELLAEKDSDLIFESALALLQIGVEKQETMEKLFVALSKADWLQRSIIIDHLSDSELAAPTATKLIGSTDKSKKNSALFVLSELDTVPLEAAESLKNYLKNKQLEDRWDAAIALGKIPLERLDKSAAHEISKVLQNALNDKDPTVRRCSMEALGKLGPKTTANIKAICLVLKTDKESLVRSSAVDALKSLACELETTIPALLQALDDKDFLVKSSAVLALESFGDRAKIAIPSVVDLLEKGELFEQVTALRFLSKFADSNLEAKAAIIKAAKSDNPSLRVLAASILSKLQGR